MRDNTNSAVPHYFCTKIGIINPNCKNCKYNL